MCLWKNAVILMSLNRIGDIFHCFSHKVFSIYHFSPSPIDKTAPRKLNPFRGLEDLETEAVEIFI